ncbi:ribose 5-phosphate isomerase B [Sandaracinobacter sp. RS1-74]|uniref:ribose 5-phosphate isomerase B n=1 Tax=Sandaracinobacteroides sayramensis TaxID=2913411 RepID=UPI001EDAA6D4|nr:ribose 5-phosphate isomerase B [Sandaracinobacteroides sayramensis]
MKIAIASDHAGYPLKAALADDLLAAGHEVIDLGAADATTSVDYPDFGRACAEKVASGGAEFGVVVCGSGIGISIAANRVAGARCALVHDNLSARLSRRHNDANMISFGARLIGAETARDALRAFLETPFEGGRHQGRVEKLA